MISVFKPVSYHRHTHRIILFRKKIKNIKERPQSPKPYTKGAKKLLHPLYMVQQIYLS